MRKINTILRRARRGFTLLELLVVIAIIGILASVAVVSFNSARSKARDAKRIADTRAVQTALVLYFDDLGSYPAAAPAAATALAGGGVTYMASWPKPPTPGGAYTYVATPAGCTTAAAAAAGTCTDYTFTITLENPNKDIGLLTAGPCKITGTTGQFTCP